jgi:transposase-like protein
MSLSNGPHPVPLPISQSEYERRLAAGESQASIARSIGVCNDTMTHWRRRWGLPPLRARRAKGVSATAFRWRDRHGYIQVPTPQGSRRRGSRVGEHILVAEAALGRELAPGEVVHHINCRRDDNRRENLLVLTRSEHVRLHATLESLVGDLMERGVIVASRDRYALA